MRISYVLKRIALGVVAPLVFALVCLWLSSYFLLNASWARDYVRTKLPKGMDVSAHRFGPNPFDLRVGGVVFADAGVSLKGGSLIVNAALFPVGIQTVDATVDELVIRGDALKDREAQQDKKPPSFKLADLEAASPPLIERLRGGVRRLWVDLPGVQLAFMDVVAMQGEGESFIVQASACEILVLEPSFAWGATTCAVSVARTQDRTRATISVILEDPTGTRIELSGEIGPSAADPAKAAAAVTLDLAVSAAVTAGWTKNASQGGLQLRGLQVRDLPLEEAPTEVLVGWNTARVDGFTGQGASFTGLETGPSQLQLWPAGLLTRVEVAISTLTAQSVQMADLEAESVGIGRVTVSFDKRAEGTIESLAIARWLVPSGVTEDLRGEAAFTVGLTGGSVAGFLTTGATLLSGALSIKRSPFGGKISVGAKFGGDDVQGAVREALVGDCVDLEGVAPVDVRGVDLALEFRGKPIAVELTRDAATATSGGKVFVWDGLDWVAPDPEP